MRRLPLVLALVALLTVAAALPVGAAPHNGNSATVLELDCGEDGIVNVLIQNRTSSVATFDAGLESNGRMYVLSWLSDRVYLGELEAEPDISEAAFAYEKSWGMRNGYNETLTCSGSIAGSDPAIGAFTEFFDVVAVGK